jgi:hypothetical protein
VRTRRVVTNFHYIYRAASDLPPPRPLIAALVVHTTRLLCPAAFRHISTTGPTHKMETATFT